MVQEDGASGATFSQFYFGIIFGVLFFVFFVAACLYRRWRLSQMQEVQPHVVEPPPVSWNANTSPVVGVVAPAPATPASSTPHPGTAPYPYSTAEYAPGPYHQEGSTYPPPMVPPQYTNQRLGQEPYGNNAHGSIY